MTHPFGLITTLRDQSLFGYGSVGLGEALRADGTITALVPSAGQNQAAPILALPIGLLSRKGTKAEPRSPGSVGVAPGPAKPQKVVP